MHGDNFDDYIRSILQDNEADYDAQAWSHMSQRLDDTSLTPDEEWVDPLVRDKLSHHEIPVSDDHWEMMETEIEEYARIRGRRIVMKTMEAAILLLLIFTYFNFQGHIDKSNTNKDVCVATVIAASHEYATDIVLSLGSGTLTNVDVHQKEENVPLTHSFQSQNLVKHRTIVSETYAARELEDDRRELGDAYNKSREAIHGGTVYEQQISTEDQHYEKSSVLSSSAASAQRDDLEAVVTPPIHAVELRPLSLLKADVTLPLTPAYIFYRSNQEVVKGPHDGVRIGVMATVDANFINTNINLEYLHHQIKTGLSGHTFGVSYAKRKGSYELETGLQYSKKTFLPGQLTSYERSSDNTFLELQLENMQMHILQIPVLAKIHSNRTSNVSLYLTAGMAFNLILQNQYTIQRSIRSKARYAHTPIAKVMNINDLPRGLSSGGELQENIYATAALGIGLQTNLTPQWSWHVQPQYQHNFNSSINPLINQINTLSIETGLKYKF